MGTGKLTDKQTEILEFIREKILANGYPPSVREICQAVGLRSTSSVHSHLSQLEEKGYIRRDPTKPRAIDIIDEEPILATENITDYFPIPPEFLHNTNKQTFILKVKGESMINIGINNGDLVIVEQCNTASNGDLVVALVDDSATVKTFYRENGYIRLQPENDAMDPIIVESCDILGKVIGLFRSYR